MTVTIALSTKFMTQNRYINYYQQDNWQAKPTNKTIHVILKNTIEENHRVGGTCSTSYGGCIVKCTKIATKPCFGLEFVSIVEYNVESFRIQEVERMHEDASIHYGKISRCHLNKCICKENFIGSCN